jgi:hypothetical protein
LPGLTQDELQAIIDAGELCAFSLDTNVFHRYGYNLETTTLLAAAQLPGRGVAFVVSQIVTREVVSHIVENEEKSSSGIASSRSRARISWRPLAQVVSATKTMAATKSGNQPPSGNPGQVGGEVESVDDEEGAGKRAGQHRRPAHTDHVSTPSIRAVMNMVPVTAMP